MSAVLNATITDLTAPTLAGKFEGRVADVLWLCVCGFLVFFMQCGFALLEAGTVRAKNTKNILMKNLMDACVGALIWWSVGYYIAYESGAGFIGGSVPGSKGNYFFMYGIVPSEGEDSAGYEYAAWFFQYVFAAAAATIVSGAMAERTALGGYIVYTVIITSFVYPVVVHWGWSGDGWISAFASKDAEYPGPDLPFNGGVVDFAGSGIVHMTGGIAALCGAAIVGPRTGRFDEKGAALPMPGHSTTLQVMGTFILWLGWYGFNPGSTLGLHPAGYARDAARVVVTTTLSAATGGITTIVTEKLIGDKVWSVGACCNGILAGLVSITAGCSVMYPWMAVLTGFIGGFIYFCASKCTLKVCKVDDPLDAFSVHGACGFWGVLAAGMFASDTYGYASAAGKGGLFYGGGFDSTGAALALLFAEIAWVGTMSLCMFVPLRAMGILRVSAEVEAAGMDVSKHGGPAYES